MRNIPFRLRHLCAYSGNRVPSTDVTQPTCWGSLARPVGNFIQRWLPQRPSPVSVLVAGRSPSRDLPTRVRASVTLPTCSRSLARPVGSFIQTWLPQRPSPVSVLVAGRSPSILLVCAFLRMQGCHSARNAISLETLIGKAGTFQLMGCANGFPSDLSARCLAKPGLAPKSSDFASEGSAPSP